MSRSIISVRNLGKRYCLGTGAAHNTLRDQITEGARRIFSRSKNVGHAGSADFWALKDVSFDIPQGEVVGIIGRNGAGKSTLLKILSQITEPTAGEVRIRGRVVSLLEVGTGFHPELSGRENVFLNGAILGMTKAEIKQKLDEIVAFAEVEKFIDTPVKRYSSGMYMRLAFAIAAHLEPEILIVDEVLAVGDAQFQKKCLGKMGEIAGRGERTIIFVSHNMTAMQTLCRRAICLKDGELVIDGPVKDVISHYLTLGEGLVSERRWEFPETAPGTPTVKIRRVAVYPHGKKMGDAIDVRTPVVIEFEYWNLQPENHLNLSVFFMDAQDCVVFNTVPLTEATWHGNPFPKALFRSRVFIPGDLLNDGRYHVSFLVVKNQGIVLSKHDRILEFDVIDSSEVRGDWHGRWPGAVRPLLKWSTELIEVLP